MIVSFLPGSAIPGNSDSQADNSSILSVCSAASFQPSLDKAGNAVGGTVTGRQWHEHKLTSRIQGWQDCLHKYMSNRKMDAGGPPDPCFFGDLLRLQTAVLQQTGRTVQYSTVQNSTIQCSAVTVKCSDREEQCSDCEVQ